MTTVPAQLALKSTTRTRCRRQAPAGRLQWPCVLLRLPSHAPQPSRLQRSLHLLSSMIGRRLQGRSCGQSAPCNAIRLARPPACQQLPRARRLGISCVSWVPAAVRRLRPLLPLLLDLSRSAQVASRSTVYCCSALACRGRGGSCASPLPAAPQQQPRAGPCAAPCQCDAGRRPGPGSGGAPRRLPRRRPRSSPAARPARARGSAGWPARFTQFTVLQAGHHPSASSVPEFGSSATVQVR